MVRHLKPLQNGKAQPPANFGQTLAKLCLRSFGQNKRSYFVEMIFGSAGVVPHHFVEICWARFVKGRGCASPFCKDLVEQFCTLFLCAGLRHHNAQDSACEARPLPPTNWVHQISTKWSGTTPAFYKMDLANLYKTVRHNPCTTKSCSTKWLWCK